MPLRRFARSSEEGGGGEAERVSPVDPAIPRHSVPDSRARRARRDERRVRGEGIRPSMEKKEREREDGRKGEPGFTSRSRANGKRRSRRTRSSTNCLRGTGLGINLLLALRLPPCPCLPSSLLSSSLFRTSPDVTRRSDEVIVQRRKKTWANLDAQ